MAKFVTNTPVEGDLWKHPAVQAWRTLHPQHPGPERVVILKEHPKQPWKRKSAVYRLLGAGPDGSAVVAKRCKAATAEVERTIYEKILPDIHVPALGYYGCIVEQGGEYCWLFLEDAQGESYSPEIAQHRQAAAEWLGNLHASTSDGKLAANLPDRGPLRYLRYVESGHDRLRSISEDPALDDSSADLLRSLARDLEHLRATWGQIAGFCADVPFTLAHGDFVAKNIRVRSQRSGIIVVPFDWETSGWGLPVADLGAGANPDLGVYGRVVHGVWPQMDLEDIEQIAVVGGVFRLAAAIDWECRSFSAQWPERTLLSMARYRERLRTLLRHAPWRA